MEGFPVLIVGCGDWVKVREAPALLVANEVGQRLGGLARISYQPQRLKELGEVWPGPELVILVCTDAAQKNNRVVRHDLKAEKLNTDCPCALIGDSSAAERAGSVWLYTLAADAYKTGPSQTRDLTEVVQNIEEEIRRYLHKTNKTCHA